MNVIEINTDELREYLDNAFEDDYEILKCYDKKYKVKTINDVCDNVQEKIFFLPEPKTIIGILDGKEKVGYFVFSPELLISFGLNKQYRNEKNLKEFFELIKQQIGNNFKCILFDYNTRAIQWLEKCGLNVLIDNVTILESCQQQQL